MSVIQAGFQPVTLANWFHIGFTKAILRHPYSVAAVSGLIFGTHPKLTAVCEAVKRYTTTRTTEP